MRILALETADKTGSVAALDGCNLLAELMLNRSQRSAQSLAPAMRDLLKQVGWLPTDVQLVAVSVGPGSFTGLRVGVTAAKVFAYAVGAEVLGVSTLEAIAANCTALEQEKIPGEVSVVMDAQRGEVVVQSFARQPEGTFAPAGPQGLLDADVWLERLQAYVADGENLLVSPLPLGEGPGVRACPRIQQDFEIQKVVGPHPNPLPKGEGTLDSSNVVVTGPGLIRLLNRLPPGVVALDQSYWQPRAAVVCRLATQYHALGRRDDIWKLAPHYYRRSAAEEKWDARVTQQ